MDHFGDTPALRLEDVRSGVWERLELDLKARLQSLREQNDFGEADDTAKRRGRIAEIKDLLAFGEYARSLRVGLDR